MEEAKGATIQYNMQDFLKDLEELRKDVAAAGITPDMVNAAIKESRREKRQ